MEILRDAVARLEELLREKDAIIEDLTRRLDAREQRTSLTLGRSDDLYNATPPATVTAAANAAAVEQPTGTGAEVLATHSRPVQPVNDLQPPPGYRIAGSGSFRRFTRFDVGPQRTSRFDIKPSSWNTNQRNVRSDESERTLQHDNESEDESTGGNTHVAGLRAADYAASPEVIESYNNSGTGSFLQFIDLGEWYNDQLQRSASTPPTSPREVYARFPFRPDRPVKSIEQQPPAPVPQPSTSVSEPPAIVPEPSTSAPDPSATAPELRRTARIPKRKQFPDYVVDQSMSKRVKRE